LGRHQLINTPSFYRNLSLNRRSIPGRHFVITPFIPLSLAAKNN